MGRTPRSRHRAIPSRAASRTASRAMAATASPPGRRPTVRVADTARPTARSRAPDTARSLLHKDTGRVTTAAHRPRRLLTAGASSSRLSHPTPATLSSRRPAAIPEAMAATPSPLPTSSHHRGAAATVSRAAVVVVEVAVTAASRAATEEDSTSPATEASRAAAAMAVSSPAPTGNSQATRLLRATASSSPSTAAGLVDTTRTLHPWVEVEATVALTKEASVDLIAEAEAVEGSVGAEASTGAVEEAVAEEAAAWGRYLTMGSVRGRSTDVWMLIGCRSEALTRVLLQMRLPLVNRQLRIWVQGCKCTAKVHPDQKLVSAGRGTTPRVPR